MANKIQVKRSTSVANPAANQLAQGELAYSFDSSKFFIGDTAGASFEIIGGKYFTDYWPAANGTVGGSAAEVVTTDSSGDIAWSGSVFTGLSSLTSHTSTDLTLAAITGQSIILTTDTGISGTAIKDENDFASDSNVHLATQQSIKAYVASQVGGVSTSAISQGNSNVTVTDVGTGAITMVADGNTEVTVNDQGVTISGNLQVDGTTTTVNSSVTQLDDPILTLGGDYGTVSAFDNKTGPAANFWINNQTNIVDATGGSGTGARFQVVGGTSSPGHVVTLSDGGTKYKDDEVLTLADPDAARISTITSSTPTTSGAWEASQTHAAFAQTSTTGSGTGATFSVVTDSGGLPTFTLVSGGTGYIATEDVTYTDPGSTSNTAAIDVATIATGDNITVDVNGVTVIGSDDNKDRGVEFIYHDGTDPQIGFFGFDDSTGSFNVLKEATNVSEVFSGTQVAIDAAEYKIGGTSILSSTVLASTVVTSGLTTVGALTTGSIAATSDFAIDTVAGNITSGGIWSIDVDGTSGAAGSLNLGLAGDTSMFITSADNNFNIASGAANTVVWTAGDWTYYDATNDGNPTISLGSSATEDFAIETIYDSGALTIDHIKFNTTAASTGADKGQYKFFVDSTNIVDINDAGIKGILASNATTLDSFTIDGGTFT